MKKSSLKLKLADYDHFDDFLQLKSESGNIYWSGFIQAPKRENLEQHFRYAIESNTREFYLLLEENIAIGYLYIDYDESSKEIEVSYGISEKKKGHGLAKFMIKQGLSKIECKNSTVFAWIAVSNVPSIKSAEALGFVKTQSEDTRIFAQEEKPVTFYRYDKCNGDYL